MRIAITAAALVFGACVSTSSLRAVAEQRWQHEAYTLARFDEMIAATAAVLSNGGLGLSSEEWMSAIELRGYIYGATAFVHDREQKLFPRCRELYTADEVMARVVTILQKHRHASGRSSVSSEVQVALWIACSPAREK